MEKMISPNGVTANMCCASCKYFTYKALGSGIRGIKTICSKKNKPVVKYGGKCNYYVMAKFFQERGYKSINRKEEPMT